MKLIVAAYNFHCLTLRSLKILLQIIFSFQSIIGKLILVQWAKYIFIIYIFIIYIYIYIYI